MLYIGQNGGDARHGRRARNKKDEAMKKNSRTAAARENRKLAESLRNLKGIDGEDQEALYGIEALLGGLETLRFASAHAAAWGNLARGLEEELAPHLDGIEAVLKKYRDGIMYEDVPDAATA